MLKRFQTNEHSFLLPGRILKTIIKVWRSEIKYIRTQTELCVKNDFKNIFPVHTPSVELTTYNDIEPHLEGKNNGKIKTQKLNLLYNIVCNSLFEMILKYLRKS